MKLRNTTIVEGIEHILRENISPMLQDDFAQNDVRMAISLLAITRLSRDDEVAIRVDELDRIRAIFAAAAPVVTDPDLASRLDEAANAAVPGLRISELDGEARRLKILLVELHGQIEEMEGEAARGLDRDIWTMLREVEIAKAPRA